MWSVETALKTASKVALFSVVPTDTCILPVKWLLGGLTKCYRSTPYRGCLIERVALCGIFAKGGGGGLGDAGMVFNLFESPVSFGGIGGRGKGPEMGRGIQNRLKNGRFHFLAAISHGHTLLRKLHEGNLCTTDAHRTGFFCTPLSRVFHSSTW